MRVTMKPALWSLLLFSASSLHAQGMAYRVPGMNRYTSSGTPDLALSLDTLRVQPAPPARVAAPAEMISKRDLAVPTKAAKEFHRSMRAFQSGDFSAAADHLE